MGSSVLLHTHRKNTFIGGYKLKHSYNPVYSIKFARNRSVVSSTPFNGPLCFIEQDTLPPLLRTDWGTKNGFERD